MTLIGKLLVAGIAATTLSGTAMAADLYAPAGNPPLAPAAADWDGPYIGANLGYGWGTLTNGTTGASAGTSGWSVGAQAGYNFHATDIIVLGAEGDINWSDETGTVGGAAFRKNWDGSLRGRLGVDVDGIMPYAEAGIAFANGTIDPDSTTHTGWTAGGGIEVKVADPVSLNAEYRYADYGSSNYGGTAYSLTDNSVRLGLNYHF
jgi:outer membrane immunogenic protein